jgi:cell division protein FtsN
VKNLGFWSHQERYEEEESLPEDEWQEERQSPMTYAFAVSILVILSVSGWFLYRWISPTSQGDIPVIQAEEGPYKVRPESPGGMVIPHQDKLVYGRLTAPQNTPQVEHLLPPPEQPILPENDQSYAEDGSLVGSEDDYLLEEPHQPQPIPHQQQAATPQSAPELASSKNNLSEENQSVAPTADEDQLDFADLEQIIEAEAKPSKAGSKTEIKITAPTVPEPKETAKPGAISLADSGNFMLQLASLPSFDTAEKEWKRLKAAEPAHFKGKGMMIQKVEKGDRTNYRLIIGPFKTANAADQFGKALKAHKVKGIVMSTPND